MKCFYNFEPRGLPSYKVTINYLCLVGIILLLDEFSLTKQPRSYVTVLDLECCVGVGGYWEREPLLFLFYKINTFFHI